MAVALWFRDLCEAYLDFGQDDFDAMLAEKTSAGQDGAAFDTFLSAAAPKGSALYVYSVRVEKEVAVKVRTLREVTVEEEIPPEEAAADAAAGDGAAAASADGGDAAAATDSKEAAFESKEDAAAKPSTDGAAPAVAADGAAASAEGAAALASSDGGAPAEGAAAALAPADGAEAADGAASVPAAPRTRMVTRLVEEEKTEVRRVPGWAVKASLGALPSDVLASVAYFVKARSGPISYPPPPGYSATLPGSASPAAAAPAVGGAGAASAAAPADAAAAAGTAAAASASASSLSLTVDDVMADCVEYGSVTADLLGGMETVVREVYTPLLEPQLGGRRAGAGGAGEEDGAGGGGDGEGSVNSGADGPGGGGAGAGARRGGRGGGGTMIGGGGGGGTVIGGGTMMGGSARRGLGGGTVIGGGTMIGGASGLHGLGGATMIGGGGLGTTLTGGGAGAGGPSAPPPAEEDKAVSGVSESVKGDFRSALHRFGAVISHTLQQVSGDVRLELPDVDVSDPAAAAQDEAVKAVLIDTVESWSRIIGGVLSVITDKDKGSRPITELEFWRARNATLSTLWEQLSHPSVRNMLAALELAREPALDPFRTAHSELSKAYVAAKDNVKFLSTLERHFKNLSTGSLPVILETIPSLMNGLRMVWVISRHYNSDDQMLPLMKRIVNELVDKVSSEVNLKSILRLAKTDPAEALAIMGQAKAVLDSWHSTYMTVRERIEKSTDHRW